MPTNYVILSLFGILGPGDHQLEFLERAQRTIYKGAPKEPIAHMLRCMYVCYKKRCKMCFFVWVFRCIYCSNHISSAAFLYHSANDAYHKMVKPDTPHPTINSHIHTYGAVRVAKKSKRSKRPKTNKRIHFLLCKTRRSRWFCCVSGTKCRLV